MPSISALVTLRTRPSGGTMLLLCPTIPTSPHPSGATLMLWCTACWLLHSASTQPSLSPPLMSRMPHNPILGHSWGPTQSPTWRLIPQLCRACLRTVVKMCSPLCKVCSGHAQQQACIVCHSDMVKSKAACAHSKCTASHGLTPCNMMNMLIESCCRKYHCVCSAQPAHRQLP